MKIFLILILMLVGIIDAFPQGKAFEKGRITDSGNSIARERLDTLYVSPGSTTYLAFPEDITLVDIGNKDFAFKVEKNILLLKSELLQGKGTNMLVKFGNELFTGWLSHTSNPHRSLYDFRHYPKNDVSNLVNQSQQSYNKSSNGHGVNKALNHALDNELNQGFDNGLDVAIKTDQIKKHLLMMGNREDKFRTFGVVKHSLSFILINLMTDSSFMYMRFKVTNKSNLIYNLDYVSFECRKKGFKESKVLQAVYLPPIKSVAAHEVELLSYVIPLYAVGAGGSYQVTFRELDGNRRAILNIPSRAVAMGEVFHDTNKAQKND